MKLNLPLVLTLARVGAIPAVLVLFYAWGPRDLDHDVDAVVEAPDAESRRAAAGRLFPERSEPSLEAGALVEHALAAMACGLVEHGVRRLVVAGGETSGAVVQALGVRQLAIGPQIDPGVPWTWARTASGVPLHLALKSGNFGTTDFFTKAFDIAGDRA